MSPLSHRKSGWLLGAVVVGLASIAGLSLDTSSATGAPIPAPRHSSVTALDIVPRGPALQIDSDVEAKRRGHPVATAWLEVLDRHSRARLLPDEVLLTSGSESGLSRLDVSPGRMRVDLSLEQLGPCEIRVDARGYVPLSGQLELVAGENRVLMARAGSLSISLRDSDGHPVEGAEVALLAPQGNGRDWRSSRSALATEPVSAEVRRLVHTASGWAHNDDDVQLNDGACVPGICDALVRAPTRRTDASGNAEWSGLPALAGYRWAIAPPRHVEATPRHEQRRLQEIGKELRTGAAPPRGISGRFEVSAGEHLELAGVVLAGARVRGRVSSPGAVAPANVTLYRVRVAGGETAKRTVSFDAEGTRQAGPDGEFLFADLRPATWMVRAWWEAEQRNLFFASQTFRLQPGADLDLGILDELQGDALDVTLGIVDQSGRELDPATVYVGDEEELFAYLSLTAAPTSGEATDMVAGLLALPFGESFRVHGLQPGHLYASVQPGMGLELNGGWISAIESEQPAGFEVGSKNALELALRARVGVSRALTLREPSGLSLAATSVWVHDVETGKVMVAPTHPAAPVGDGESRQLTLPPGTYDLWCKLSTDFAPEGLVGGATVVFDANRRDPIEIAMRPAASASGVLRDPNGTLLPGQTVTWTLRTWPLDGGRTPLYSATTDSQGAFTVREIPVGASLRSTSPGTDLPALRPGPHDGIELVLAD